MKKYGIFYGSTTGNTKVVAEKLQQLVGQEHADLLNVGEVSSDEMKNYEHLILGASTWGYGELQDDWESFITTIDSERVAGKKISLFGVGDSQMYPDTFVDAMGLMYEKLESMDCEIVGQVDSGAYEFDGSKALLEGKFVGLPLDEDNEGDLTDKRLKNWVKEFFI